MVKKLVGGLVWTGVKYCLFCIADVCVKILQAFSVYTNGSKLLSTGQPAGSITCIHGIRFLSMTWVVLGHGFLFPQQVSGE